MQAVTEAIIEAIDATLELSAIQLAVRIATDALIKRIAELLMVLADGIEAGKLVAHYGVDSIIAVELQS